MADPAYQSDDSLNDEKNEGKNKAKKKKSFFGRLCCSCGASRKRTDVLQDIFQRIN